MFRDRRYICIYVIRNCLICVHKLGKRKKFIYPTSAWRRDLSVTIIRVLRESGVKPSYFKTKTDINSSLSISKQKYCLSTCTNSLTVQQDAIEPGGFKYHSPRITNNFFFQTLTKCLQNHVRVFMNFRGISRKWLYSKNPEMPRIIQVLLMKQEKQYIGNKSTVTAQNTTIRRNYLKRFVRIDFGNNCDFTPFATVYEYLRHKVKLVNGIRYEM